MGRWVRLEMHGVLRSLTVLATQFEGFPRPGYAFGYLQLAGADTALAGYLNGPDWTQASNWSDLIGTTWFMKALPERSGDWLDWAFSAELSDAP